MKPGRIAAETDDRGLRRRSRLVIGLVVLLGLLGTVLSTVTLHLSARNWSDRTFDQKQDVIAKVVTAELVQYAVALADLAASVGAQPELTATSFAAITAPINGHRLPGAVEVTYVVPATGATVDRVRTAWRSRGGTDVPPDLARTGSDELFLPVLGRPLDSGSGVAGGGTQTPEAVAAMREARSGIGFATSPTFQPAGATVRSFIMAAAVRASLPATEAGQFRGWVTMTFRGGDFLGPPVGLIGGDQVSVDFADVSGGTPVIIVSWRPDAPIDTDLKARTVAMPPEFGQWQLTIHPTVRLIPQIQAWLAPGAAAVGGVITVLLATLTGTVATSRDRALRRVAAATAELRDDIARREAVEQQLRRREDELVGFAGVVAHDLRNPLANVIGFAEMIDAVDDGNLTGKQTHYLSRVRGSATLMQHLIDDLLAYATADDGVLRITRVPLDDLVDSILDERAGHGAAAPPVIERSPLPTVLGDPTLVRQVLDNLIGNAIKYTPADRPAEITITAALGPAPGPTSHTAPAASGLAFPPALGLATSPAPGLASSPAAASGLASSPAAASGLASSPAAASGLASSPAAASGLASSPAAASGLASSSTDASGLVSPADPAATGLTSPNDPAIGGPAQTTHPAVTGLASPDGPAAPGSHAATTTCRIEVADRGIGIPDEQRSEVFNAFTRADGSERYPGTGLGLAIVQRIVERHGGTVGVDPNPGGGSRFWFTLPLDPGPHSTT